MDIAAPAKSRVLLGAALCAQLKMTLRLLFKMLEPG
jgi:hypothetical protein